MDRPLDSAHRVRTIARRLVWTVVIAAGIVACVAVARPFMTPGVARARIRTAVVDRGPLESTMSASGTVVPEVELVVSSPIDARVLKILKRAGDAVRPGDAIVQLDTSATALSIDKIDQDIALKANAQAGVRLDLDKTLEDLKSQVATKKLDLDALVARLEQDRKLAESGLTSSSAVRDAELAVSKARIELAQLESQIENARSATRTKIEGLVLEMSTLKKERAEASRLLSLATMRADRDGVLTWVIAEEGATVARGAVIARIADLRSFRVDATLSDAHTQDVSTGLPVRVKLGDDIVNGTISSVLPTIQNGTLTVQIALEDSADPRLKANLRCDVYVVTAFRESALRLKKGPFATSGGPHDVFVVSGDRATKRRIELGISGVDAYEVVSGLQEGEEVLVSDPQDYSQRTEIAIR